MRKFVLILCLILLNQSGHSQEKRTFFSEEISIHLPKYQAEANKAYRVSDMERAEFLFDSLVDFCLKGSHLDNFKVHNLKKKEVHLNDFEKPVFLRTYASWLVPTAGEIPALNKLAEEYQKDIQIVVLLWDTRKSAKALAKKYHESITVLYVDELQNKSPGVIRTMKHSLGFPTSFLLDRDKKILDIRRSISHPYGISDQESFNMNYDSLSHGISLLLLKDYNQFNPQESVAKLP